MKAKHLLQYYGILLGLTVLLVHYLLSFLPYTMIDKIYTLGIYPLFKWFLWPFQWLPFPSLYLFIIALLMFLVLFVLQNIHRKPLDLLKICLRQILNFIGLIMFLFYASWAFNYSASGIQDRLQLTKVETETDDFYELYDTTTEALIQKRNLLTDSALSISPDMNALSAEINTIQRNWLSQWGYPIRIPAKVKPLYPGFLLRISTAGFYFPLGGEGYYDGGLHCLTVPFVIAHELAHNYGVTNEGEANFVAFHTCMQSKDLFIQYSGLLDFWRYLAGTYRRMDPDSFQKRREQVPEVIWEDLRQIRNQHEKFPDVFPQLRDKIYNMYLQSQGVEEGLQSYAKVIELELAYRKKYPSRK